VSGTPIAGEWTWIVTLAPNASPQSVAKDLVRTGLTVDQVLEAAGAVVAHGTEADAQAARRIPGVTDVSKDLAFDIGPPGSQIS
jgi:hypothetical protein